MANYPKSGLELELKGLEDKFLKGLEKADKGLDRFDKQMDQVASNSANINAAMEKTSRSMISLGDVIGAVGLYRLTGEFTQFLSAAYAGAAQFEALALGNQQFAASIGTTTDALGVGTKAAALGMIDDAEAIRQANEAIMTGAVGSQAEMEEMARIAVSLGITMGKTAAESIDIFTTALGKGQPRLLYQLGITLDVDKAEQAYAASIGKTAAALTEIDKKEAVRTAALARGRDIMQQQGDISDLQIVKMQRLTTSWDEFGDSLGRFMVAGEQGASILDKLNSVVVTLTEGADAWTYVFDEAIPAIQKHNEEVAQATESANGLVVKNAQLTGSYEELMTVLGGLGLEDTKRLLFENVSGFQEWVRIVNEMSARGYVMADMLREVTQEEFDLGKAAVASAKQQVASIDQVIIGWDKMGGALLAAAAANERNIDITTYGIEVNRWWAASLAGVAGAFGNVDAASKTALDAILKQQKAIDQGWRDSGSALASYILAAQDAKAGLTGGGTGGADAEKTANEDRIQNNIDLKSRLIEIEQERAEKIKWVHDGDHARSAEQNAADLQFWNDHYDRLTSQTILSYTGRNVEIQKKEDEAKAIAAKAAAEEKAAFDARMVDLKTSAALTIMETQGTLTQFTGGMATTAADALEKMKAGVITVTPDMASKLAGVLAGVNTDMATAVDTQVANMGRLKDAQDGVINDSATLAGITTDAVDQVTVPPETTTKIEAISVALNGAMTMFDTLATKAEGNKTIFFESVKKLPDAVDEVDWEDEVGKPIVEGIAKGLTDNTQITNDAMKGLVTQMLAAATSAAGAQSPATEFMPLGEDITAGILAGMESTGEEIDATAQGLMHNLMKNFVGGRGLGSDVRRRVLEQFDDIMEDMVIGGTTTYQEALQGAIGQLIGGMNSTIRAMVQQSLPELWDAMGNLVQQTIISPLERAAQMFSLGGIMGSLASTALALERSGMADSTKRMQELEKALGGYTSQLDTLDKQLADARLRAGLGFGGEDQIAALERQRTDALAKQIADQEELNRLKADAAKLEEKQLALQEAQTKMQFLQQQMSLVKTIQEAGLNPADILGGLKLGLDADLNAVVAAMTAAMNAILQRADSTLGLQHGGAFTVPAGHPRDSFRVGLTSGERVVVSPAGFQAAGANVSVTFGNVTVSNGWDVAILRSQVTQWVSEAVGA